MGKILVNKSIEKRGKIGPFYIYEACLLVLFGMAYLLGLVMLNASGYLNKGWILSCPLVLACLLLGLLFCRRQDNPTYLSSLLAFYKQPKSMNAHFGTLCYKIKKK